MLKNLSSFIPLLFIKLISILLIIFQVSTVGANDWSDNQQQPIHFNNLDPEVVRLHPASKSITQDARGFIWIASQDGLNRFDGKNLLHFNSVLGSPNSLLSNWSNRLFTDSQGRIWITSNKGINLYLSEAEGFKQFNQASGYSGLSAERFNLIAQTSENKMWFSELEGGLFSFDLIEQVFAAVPLQSEVVESKSPPEVMDLVSVNENELWISTKNDGLFVLNEAGITQLHTGSSPALPSNTISKIALADDGTVWFAAAGGPQSGLYNYSPKEGIIEKVLANDDTEKCTKSISSFAFDSSNTLWIGSEFGLCSLNLIDLSMSLHANDKGRYNSLIDNRINDLYFDRGGVLWVATMGGVSSFNAKLKKFTHISQGFGIGKGMSSNVVTSFAQNSQNELFVGTWGGGVNRFSPKSNTFINYTKNDLSNNQENTLTTDKVMSLSVDQNDNLWIGTINKGLFKKSPEQDAFINFSSDSENPTALSNNAISKILLLKGGHLLVATYGGGINIKSFDDQFIQHKHDKNEPSSLSDDRVLDIWERENGDIWVATNGGGLNLFLRDSNEFQRFTTDQTSEDNLLTADIYAILETTDYLWLGTQDAGLAQLDLALFEEGVIKFKHFTTTDGLASNVVYGMLEDNTGNIWFSHSLGISVMDSDGKNIRHFDKSQGLQGRDFTAGAFFKNQEGRMFFGGSNGFNTFLENEMPINAYEAPLELISITVMNKEIPIHKAFDDLGNLVLDYNNSSSTFGFSLLDFTRPEQNTYQYMVDGLQNEWVNINKQNTISLTNLADGEFVLKIRGINADGFISNNLLQIPIIVNPPWWRANLAYFLYLIFSILFILLVLQRQKKIHSQRIARQKNLEATVDERTQQLKNSNSQLAISIEEIANAKAKTEQAAEAKSLFLATMSHEIRTPMNSILGMGELLLNTQLSHQQRQYAKNAHRSGEMLLEMINDILDFSKIEVNKLSLEEVEFDLHNAAEEAVFQLASRAHEKGLTLTINIDPDCPAIFIGDSVRMRQILINIVGNAIKFTEHGYVNLTLTFTSENHVLMKVEDTGIGIPADKIESIFNAFEQAESSTTRRFGGSGLGLNITSTLVELMGGDIQVSSVFGEGTCFTIDIPLEAVNKSHIKVDVGPESVQFYSTNVNLIENAKSLFTRLHIEYQILSSLQQLPADQIQDTILMIDIELLKNSEYDESMQAHKESLIVISSTTEALNEKYASYCRLMSAPLTQRHLVDTLQDMKILSSPVAASESPFNFGKHHKFAARILLVEDSKTNQQVAYGILHHLGCEINIAENGVEAIEHCQKQQYDLVFMDHQMPIMDGITATGKIKSLDTAMQPRFIVALTADNSLASQERWIAASVDKLMMKPFTAAEMLFVLKQFLSDKIIDIESPAEHQQADNSITRQKNPSDILDMETIGVIIELSSMNSEDMLGPLLTIFEEEIDENLSKLHHAYDIQNADTVYKLSHSLKSITGNIGAKQLYELFQIIEQAAEKNELSVCHEQMACLDEILRVTLLEFQKITN